MPCDAGKVCSDIEACFGLFGVVPGSSAVDYYSMYYLKCSYFESDEFFEGRELQNLIDAGFRQIDLNLYNAAIKCNLELFRKLLQQGADPHVDFYCEGIESDLVNSLNDDITANMWFYEEYFEITQSNRMHSEEYILSMLRVLFDMASSARLLRLIGENQA